MDSHHFRHAAFRVLLCALLAAAAAAGGAWAQEDATLEPEPDLTFGSGTRTVIVTALFGVQTFPEYFGSDDSFVGPQFRPNVGFLSFGPLRFGRDAIANDPNARRRGLGVAGSFNFVPARDADDHDELDGMEDVDWTIEAGVLLGYFWPNAEAFASVRYGFHGHEGFVGEVGANYVARPSDRWAIRFGPRAFFGSDGYADTYFGVSGREAAASQFNEFDADGGLLAAGVEVIATYRLSDRWWLEGGATYSRYQNDAADSPIVRAGSEEETRFRIGVRRAFVLDF